MPKSSQFFGELLEKTFDIQKFFDDPQIYFEVKINKP